MKQFKQITDFLVYRNKHFCLTAVKGDALCDITDFHLYPISFSCYCQKGYFIEYICENNYLYIHNIYVSANGQYPIIAGVAAVDFKPNFLMSGFKIYRDVMIRLRFSGTLLIGDRPIQSFKNCNGDQPSYSFRETHKLVFRKGNLITATDISYDMVKVRKNILSPILYYEKEDNWGKT